MQNDPTGPTGEAVSADRPTLEAYRQWLHLEGRILGMELYPELGDDADRYIPERTAARHFHFPPGQDWRAVPKPSTRARLVLATVGVDLDEDACGTPSAAMVGVDPFLDRLHRHHAIRAALNALPDLDDDEVTRLTLEAREALFQDDNLAAPITSCAGAAGALREALADGVLIDDDVGYLMRGVLAFLEGGA